MSSAERKQQTLAAPAEIRGVGYWSGCAVRLEFRPAAVNTGIVFVRRDLAGQPRIPAMVACRTETPLRTVLCREGACVEMIEHVMAALSGMQIDNCEIWTDAPEMPGADGSCLPFIEVLGAAGRAEQDAPRSRICLRRPIRCGDSESWIEARPTTAGKMILAYELDYGSGNPIGRQSLEITLSTRHFCQNLAPSRTFILESEALILKSQGLGRHVTCKDLLIFGPQGPIDNPLRFPDECVRHKLADMVGDLALAGCDLIGRFVAYRSGHRLNAELVRRLLAAEGELPTRSLKRCA
jgi:UDP-3-O-[3-hydroxymyristoyl] N-acetylglucosamine deacetylase